jgi:autotransporter translocation and assembly factor TamB
MLRKVLRWTYRIVGGVIALAVLLVAIVIGAVHTQWGRQRIKAEIQSQLRAEFPGSTIGSVQGSPFGTLVVSGITITGKDGRPFVTIATLTVDVQLRPLLRRVVRLQNIEADGMLVDLAAQPDPKPSASATKPDDKPSSWDIEMPDIAVHQATVIGEERVENIELAAGLVLHDGAIDASVAVTAKWRGQPASASAIVHYGDELRVPMAHAALGDGELTATAVRVGDPLSVDGVLAVRVPADLAKLLADVDITGDAAAVVHLRNGMVAFDGTLTGPYASRVRGTAHVDLVKRSGDAVVAIENVYGRAIATLAGDEHRVRGLVAGDGAYEDHAGGALAAVDVTREGDLIELANALVTAHGKSTTYGTGVSSHLPCRLSRPASPTAAFATRTRASHTYASGSMQRRSVRSLSSTQVSTPMASRKAHLRFRPRSCLRWRHSMTSSPLTSASIV